MPRQGQGSCCPARQLSYLAVGDALLAPDAVCLQLLHLSQCYLRVSGSGLLSCSDQ